MGGGGHAPRTPRGKGPYGPLSGHSLLLHLHWPLITNIFETPVTTCRVDFIFTGSYPCQVISGSISGVKAESFVVLVMLKTPHAETFHLVQYEGSIGFKTCQNIIFILVVFYYTNREITT